MIYLLLKIYIYYLKGKSFSRILNHCLYQCLYGISHMSNVKIHDPVQVHICEQKSLAIELLYLPLLFYTPSSKRMYGAF